MTEEVCVPILEAESGLRCGADFTVGYSPERINPGDKVHTLETIKKIVSGSDAPTLDLLAERGFDSTYGARPLRRCLQSGAETLIAKKLLSGDLGSGSTLVLDAENGELVCRVKQ